MIIIPAVDIMNGKAVRLIQGDFKKVKVYPRSPVEYVRRWQSQGAKLLHIVDLDGARTGEPSNFKTIEKIVKAVKIPVEIGGGIRDEATIERFLKLGVSYVIIGTKAITDIDFLKRIVSKYKKRIVVSVDSKGGLVKIGGWKKRTNLKTTKLLKELEAIKLKRVVFTDISRDGMLKGMNINSIKKVFQCTKKLQVIASGGLTNYTDILLLGSLNEKRLFGAISGKALYERKINLRKAQELC